MIVVVAKQPVPGQVKTRLCPPLTPPQAARLAEAFLAETVRKAIASAAGRVAIGFTPAHKRTWFASRFGDICLLEQGEDDLGARMKRLFEQAFSQEEAEVLLIGADTPHLPPDRLEAARSQLACGADVVLGPADDGGYYLIGLRRPIPSLFAGVDWGSPRVLEQTQALARQSNLKVALLPRERDIDDPEDLDWLRKRSDAYEEIVRSTILG